MEDKPQMNNLNPQYNCNSKVNNDNDVNTLPPPPQPPGLGLSPADLML